MRILVEIAYQGNQFLGFQIQQQGRTVQQQFEKILKRMHKHHVRIHPSSRTDRGVHAYQQFFHFDTELNIDNKQWQYAMNRALPDDIYVKNVRNVDEYFHCRYDCVGKRYRYKVYQGNHRNPFKSGTETFVYETLDYDKMNKAAQEFIGTHDFDQIYENYPIRYSIIGHVHFRKKLVENNILYICPCLGYQRQWMTDDITYEINHALVDFDI